MTQSPRFWYECKDGNLTKVLQHPGTSLTDPALHQKENSTSTTPSNLSYWVYTHFGLNIIWLVTMLLLLLNCSSDSTNNGKILSKCISKYFVELILSRQTSLYQISLTTKTSLQIRDNQTLVKRKINKRAQKCYCHGY